MQRAQTTLCLHGSNSTHETLSSKQIAHSPIEAAVIFFAGKCKFRVSSVCVQLLEN
jgi:hypothetical protein